MRQSQTGQTFADSRRTMPYGKAKFLVEIDGFVRAGFQKAGGLEASVEERSYRDGGDNNTFRKGPGLTTYTDITLSRGSSEDEDFMNWFKEVSGGAKDPNFRRSLAIIVLDDDGVTEAKRYNVANAWCKGYKMDELDAASSDNLIETLTIAHEGFEKV